MKDARPDRLLMTVADLDDLLEDRSPVLVFKHSTACPISGEAYRQFKVWLAEKGAALRTAMVRVIEERPVSLEIASRLGVTHQSPQAILIRDGQAVWEANHLAITAEALAQACA